MQMKNAAMPPGGGASAAEIAAFQAWVDAGYPDGDCTAETDPAFSGPTTCSRGKTWPANNFEGDALMQPGRACNQCHQSPPPGEGEDESPPIFTVAGTVYATGHEPDLCLGIHGPGSDGVVVHIIGKDGVDVALSPNSSGNFTYRGPLAKPYTAKVVSAAGERVMSEPQNEGDCNRCHTENGGANGANAPGRIVVPY
jgi:hypothetical protein